MVARCITVYLREEDGQLRHEGLYNTVKVHPHVHNLVRTVSDNGTHMFRFHTTTRRAREVLELLHSIGVGTHFGVIEILDVKSTLPRLSNHPTLIAGHQQREKDFHYKFTNTLTLEEIYDHVDSMYHLTFEYLGMCAAASVVCAVGLVTNNDPAVVASMLLSPLMGPVLGIVLGVMFRDWHITLTAFRNEVIGVVITFIIGLVTGFIMIPFKTDDFETNEMAMRGVESGLVPGILIALPCGMALALSVTNNNIATLVGVAIAAALLPPICNSGIELAFGFMDKYHHRIGNVRYFDHAAVSFILFLTNCLAVFVGALFIFVVKRIQPVGHQQRGVKPRATSSLNSEQRPLLGVA